jgi:predicted nuclease with TOPRIM domain
MDTDAIRQLNALNDKLREVTNLIVQTHVHDTRSNAALRLQNERHVAEHQELLKKIHELEARIGRRDDRIAELEHEVDYLEDENERLRSRTRRCGRCRMPGHDIRTCPRD